MRLVTSRNPAGAVHRFVTDRFDLSAAEVVALYRKRWQIELFFRWLKHQLKALHPLGTSREAVWLTVLLGAIAGLVASLVDPDRPRATPTSPCCAASARRCSSPSPPRHPPPPPPAKVYAPDLGHGTLPRPSGRNLVHGKAVMPSAGIGRAQDPPLRDDGRKTVGRP